MKTGSNKRSYYGLFLITFTIAVLSTASVFAAIVEPPVKLLKDISNQVIKILVDDSAQLKADPAKVYEIVNNYILPHLDNITMAKLALGKNWRKASRAQKLAFIDEFCVLLVRTYSKSLLAFKNQRIIFSPVKLRRNAKIISVRAEVIQPGGPPIPLTYRMHLKNNAWKVYDISVDGISLVTTYRGTFTQEVRKSGINGLLKYLREKNSKLNEPGGSQG